MSAPALLKTWQIEGDNLVPLSDTYTERKTLLLGIVNKLIGFASNPMTVIGSNNTTASGMDAVNRWSTISDITNNSWIVLQQAGVNAKFQICLFCSGNWASNQPLLTIVVSRLAGFGTANGGGDGSTSARPTASDEHALAAQNLATASGSIAARYYVWQSTDGQMTHVLIRNATAGSWFNHWFWGKPRNPRALWTDPCVYRFFGSGNLGDPNAIANVIAYKGTTQVTSIAITTAKEAVLAQNNDWEGANAYDTYRAYLSSHTLAGSKGGNIGELFDTRLVDSVVSNGTRMPFGGPYTWCSFGDTSGIRWLLPWDNATTPKFSAAA